MKKIIVLLLALTMIISLAACGKKPAEEQETTTKASKSENQEVPEGAVTDEKKLGEAITYSVDGEDLYIKIKTSEEFDAKNAGIAIVNPGLYLTRDSSLITQSLFDEKCFDEEFDKEYFDGVYVFKIDSRIKDIASGEWAPGTWTMMLYDGNSRNVIGEWLYVAEGEGKYHFEFSDSWLKGAGEDKKVKEFDSLQKEVESWFSCKEYNEDFEEFYFDGYYLEEKDTMGYDKYYLMVCPEGDYKTYADADAVNLSYAGVSEKCPYKFAIEQGGIVNGKYAIVLTRMGGNVEVQFNAEKISDTKWKLDFEKAKCPALDSKYADKEK